MAPKPFKIKLCIFFFGSIFLQLIPASIYLTEDFGSSEIATPAGKLECLDTAEAVTFYRVKVMYTIYVHHLSSSSQVNLG